jgi:hypothetical protein
MNNIKIQEIEKAHLKVRNTIKERLFYGVVEKPQISGLFNNVQMRGAQKPYREAYMNIR